MEFCTTYMFESMPFDSKHIRKKKSEIGAPSLA